jgi:arylsulfatase
MQADRTEQHDLAGAQPERVASMAAQWDAWAKRSFVDEWNGPDHTDWGQDIKKEGTNERK